ncbi:MAG: response regulator [Bacteroidales bacterium]|nr:response regulator [Bacteroidales bacterium]HNW72244.1 response regulator [Bacteroidales bacterium]HPS49724.1 response regulator [Bacteroidales bacterium]
MDRKIILLVEDNPDDVELTRRAFEKANLTNPMTVVNDGAKAIDYIKGLGEFGQNDQHRLPAIILLDLKLPKVDGLEVLKEIRNFQPTQLTPVIILTSSLEEQDLINCYLNGANSYIRKPVDFNKFTQAVQQLGMYWLLLNELPPNPES